MGMTAPWIKVRGDNATLTTFCERCGHAVTFKLPISVTDLVTMTAAFVREHRACKEASE